MDEAVVMGEVMGGAVVRIAAVVMHGLRYQVVVMGNKVVVAGPG